MEKGKKNEKDKKAGKTWKFIKESMALQNHVIREGTWNVCEHKCGWTHSGKVTLWSEFHAEAESSLKILLKLKNEFKNPFSLQL